MIYYFSGSGNSRHLAGMIARESRHELFSLNEFFKNHCSFRKGRELIECGEELPLPDDKHELLVFVYPTYGWRQPRMLTSFLAANGRLLRERKLYFVATAGSGFGGSEKYLRLLCRDIGAEFMGLATILMPENYTAMFPIPDEAEAKRLINNAESKAKEAAAVIKAGSRLMPDSDLCRWPFVLSTVVNPLFYTFLVKSRAFYADDRCDSCRVCELICPLNCIRMEQNDSGQLRPKWDDNCTHCMACINHCPEKAIEYGKASLNKRRYYI